MELKERVEFNRKARGRVHRGKIVDFFDSVKGPGATVYCDNGKYYAVEMKRLRPEEVRA